MPSKSSVVISQQFVPLAVIYESVPCQAASRVHVSSMAGQLVVDSNFQLGEGRNVVDSI